MAERLDFTTEAQRKDFLFVSKAFGANKKLLC
jgi:hypothetical protein